MIVITILSHFIYIYNLISIVSIITITQFYNINSICYNHTLFSLIFSSDLFKILNIFRYLFKFMNFPYLE